ncbi:DUF2489 domain-containing protein [Nostoc sp. FACHB-888]|uniref:DUF2489 domain-containing protein n=1 Tax=Nostoc sp. FACHB-888 TaxID=2692842 RepID=UPI00168242E1|nr:DUF2489 domain-containing protein [Nostoc sp. FACHB-888]MBD2247992.1 DUF2489 domain-containing protein [Nostoc sp. FACHB-888]
MERVKTKIIELATKMIKQEIDLLDGCRILVQLQGELKESPESFFVLRGIDSETDIFPISEAEKKQCNPEALSRLDKEKNEYILLVKEEILEACRKIITTLNTNL